MAERLPPWAADERILALDLYLRRRTLDKSDPEVIALSELMRSLPIHQPHPSDPRFRNPDGVALKLSNFAALDPRYPGVGMTRLSEGDRETWDLFSGDPQKVAALAAAIKAGAKTDLPPEPKEEEEAVEEGAVLYRLHRTLERNRRLVARVKREAMQRDGALLCRVCGYDFEVAFSDYGRGYIECHHIVPLAELGPRPELPSGCVETAPGSRTT